MRSFIKKIYLIEICILISSCFQKKEIYSKECGTKIFDKSGNVIYFVECDSSSGLKIIENKISKNELTTLYIDENTEIEFDYYFNRDIRSEYRLRYKNEEMYTVTYALEDSTKRVLELVSGTPIVLLSDTSMIDSNNFEYKIFYISDPSFAEKTLISTFQINKNGDSLFGFNDYLLKKSFINLKFNKNQDFYWKIIVKQTLMCGKERVFEQVWKKDEL